MYKVIQKNNYLIKKSLLRNFSSSLQLKSNNSYTSDDQSRYPVPEFKPPADESLKNKKARLIYQSRKRGMLENGLLLSTFIHKYLNTMTEKQLELYDSLINKPSNDWDLYYWAVGVKPTPPEFDNEIMDLFKLHVQNIGKESRIRQPDLP